MRYLSQEPFSSLPDPEVVICAFPVDLDGSESLEDPLAGDDCQDIEAAGTAEPESDFDPMVLEEHQDSEGDSEDVAHNPESFTTRVDRFDETGAVIGYTLITTSEWDSSTEFYDLNDNLVGTTYSDISGYSQSSAWQALLDESGTEIGRIHTSISSDGSWKGEWSETFDAAGNLLASRFSSSEGDWETMERTPPPELQIGPAPLSHAHQVYGAWADGSSYSRIELFDIYGNLVQSESHYGDGSSEKYAITPVFADDGTLQGYEGAWTWTDASGETSTSGWTDHFDTNLNPIKTSDYADNILHTKEEDPADDFFIDLENHPEYAYRDIPVMYAMQGQGSPIRTLDEARPRVLSLPADQSAYLPPADPEDFDSEGDYATEPWYAAEEEQEAYIAESVDSLVNLPSFEDLTGYPLAANQRSDFSPEAISPMALPGLPVPASTMLQTFISSADADVRLNQDQFSEITHAMLSGDADLSLRGNRLANVLIGNHGNNKISGGHAKDLLTGGIGGDFFIFRNQRRSRDTITDFDAAQDKLVLRGKDFAALFNGDGLRDGVIGKTLIFEESTSRLLFVPEGEGNSSKPTRLAVLPGLAAADFGSELFLFG